MRRNGHATGQTAATDRRDKRIQPGDLLQQFERHRTLPGHDPGVGVGMHQYRAGGTLDVGAASFPRGLGRRAAMQDRARTLDRLDLGSDRAFGHHHMGGDTAGRGGQSQCVAVVAGGMRDHAVRGLRLRSTPRPHCRRREI